jgi:hypothetical protein
MNTRTRTHALGFVSCGVFPMFLPSCLHRGVSRTHCSRTYMALLVTQAPSPSGSCTHRPHAHAHIRRLGYEKRTRACPSTAPPLLLPLLDPYQRERERERERERGGGKISGRASDIHTHLRTIERKQAFCASLPSLPPSAPLHVSPFLPRLSLSSHSRARAHTQLRTAGWEERGQRRVSSLSLNTHMPLGAHLPTCMPPC